MFSRFLLLITTLVVFANHLWAEERLESAEDQNLIEVHYEADIRETYKKSRDSWSTVFSLGLDNLYPDKYTSVDGGQSYESLYDQAKVPIIQIGFGIKWNFIFGGLAAEIAVGTGQASSDVSGDSRNLQLTKSAATLSYYMDNIFEEPYVVPYASGGMVGLQYSETGGAQEDKGSTQPSSFLQAGVLLQLDWLDPEAAVVARNEFGLNNTYLDIFASKYSAPTTEEDPDFQTGLNLGMGLRMEF